MNIGIRVDENGGGGFEADDMSSGEELPLIGSPVDWTSELTISFQGELYIFPAVTPQKVQAVLLLFGGSEMASVIRRELTGGCRLLIFGLCLWSVDNNDPFTRPNISWRTASLIRFREKRNRDALRKKFVILVGKKLHRGEGENTSADNIDSGDSTPHPEPTLTLIHIWVLTGLGHDIHYSKLTQSMKIPNNTTCHLQT